MCAHPTVIVQPEEEVLATPCARRRASFARNGDLTEIIKRPTGTISLREQYDRPDLEWSLKYPRSVPRRVTSDKVDYPSLRAINLARGSKAHREHRAFTSHPRAAKAAALRDAKELAENKIDLAPSASR